MLAQWMEVDATAREIARLLPEVQKSKMDIAVDQQKETT